MQLRTTVSLCAYLVCVASLFGLAPPRGRCEMSFWKRGGTLSILLLYCVYSRPLNVQHGDYQYCCIATTHKQYKGLVEYVEYDEPTAFVSVLAYEAQG